MRIANRVLAGTLLIAISAAAVVGIVGARAPKFDLVIRNGSIVDGTGNPSFIGSVGVTDGQIVAVGDFPGEGKEEIDAKGLVVAPGFIDVHTHAENVLELPKAENFVRMGVTSVVIGNCGGSADDIGALFTTLTEKPVSVNVASLVGHNTVRRAAMGGNFDRDPSEAEMAKMKEGVAKAMREGAVGLSTGLIYLPGTYSKTEEIIELAKVAKSYNGIYASHIRSESSEVVEAVTELLRIGRESGCRIEYSHIKLGGENMWGKTGTILEMLAKAREDGVEVTQDQYAYTASSTSISTLIPDEALEGGKFKERLAAPEEKAKMVAYMKKRLSLRNRTDYGYAFIAQCKADARLNGKNLIDAAQIRRGAGTLDDQIETVLWIQENGGASAVFHGMNEDDVRAYMRHPNTMIASDASCRAFGEDVPHPRGYGNNARVLGKYVRDEGVLRLEDAIRKMTSLPAQTFRLRDRGQIREGMAADIVIFDPKTVRENTTYDKPHAYATGFKAVLVNGAFVVKDDVHTGNRPGVPLRRNGIATAKSETRAFHVDRHAEHDDARL